jgi:hypothetical protein
MMFYEITRRGNTDASIIIPQLTTPRHPRERGDRIDYVRTLIGTVC